MSVSIVTIVDQSGSMGYEGYLAPAQTDASTFVNIMNTGDSLGAVAFSDNATIIFGSSNALTQVTGQSTLDAASSAIMALQSQNMTNMAAALSTAAGMIAGATGNRGQIFLSDGVWNNGGDPLPGLATSPPIYTIALGPGGEQSVLQAIATKTGGTYHYAPNALQLAEIYNAIASQTLTAQLVTHAQPTVQPFKFVGTPGVVPSGTTQASFALNWDNWAVTYTPNTPTGNQVNVFLTDPNGATVSTTATAVGNGYVTFKIPSPMAGTYTAYAWYAGTSPLAYTAAIFDNNHSIIMQLVAPEDPARPGEPIEFQVQLADEGEPIEGAVLRASMESPLVSVEEALITHKTRLSAMPGSFDAAPDGGDRAKLAALQRLLLPHHDILPRGERPCTATAAGGGRYRMQVASLDKPGSHTLRVEASGFSRRSNTAFARSSRLSILMP